MENLLTGAGFWSNSIPARQNGKHVVTQTNMARNSSHSIFIFNATFLTQIIQTRRPESPVTRDENKQHANLRPRDRISALPTVIRNLTSKFLQHQHQPLTSRWRTSSHLLVSVVSIYFTTSLVEIPPPSTKPYLPTCLWPPSIPPAT